MQGGGWRKSKANVGRRVEKEQGKCRKEGGERARQMQEGGWRKSKAASDEREEIKGATAEFSCLQQK